MHEDRAFLPVINVSFSHQGVFGRKRCVYPKTTVQQMPVILAVLSVEIRKVPVANLTFAVATAKVRLRYFAKIRWVLSLIFPPYCTVPNPCTWVPPPPVTKPPCVSAELFVITSITPFTALAPHTVPPGP